MALKSIKELEEENKQLKAQLDVQTQKVTLLQEKFDNLKSRRFFKLYRSLFRALRGSDPIFEN